MSFRDFTFPDVVDRFGLTVDSARLIPDLSPAPAPVSAEFRERLREGLSLAGGSNNETARSRFVVAPVLVEFRRLSQRRHAILSGLALDVGPPNGACGVCGFVISRGPRFDVPTSVAAVIEVENGSATFRLGPCVAGMRAAWLSNSRRGDPDAPVYGVVTTGGEWRFLRLRDTQLTVHRDIHFITEAGKILGILLHMATTA